MNLTRKEKILILAVIIFCFILLILSAVLLLRRESSLDNSNNKVVSYNEPPLIDEKSVSFNLETPNMGINKPIKWILSMKFLINDDYVIDVKKGIARIQGTDFEIAIFTNLGESGGFYNSVSIEDTFNDIKLNKTLYKVKTSYSNLSSNTLEDKFTDYYFYTQDFRSKEVCGEAEPTADGCGAQEITVSTEFNKFHFSIYCGVKKNNLVKVCDEFVKNLNVHVKEVSNN